VVDGGGDGRLEHLTLADRGRGAVEEVPAAALFIMIGGEPHTQWLPDEIERDAQGFLVTGRDVLERPGIRWDHDRDPLLLETSMSGVFAAGDVRRGSIKASPRPLAKGDGRPLVHEHLREAEPAAVAD
jgi:thioredoxin reductase (NADPH)